MDSTAPEGHSGANSKVDSPKTSRQPLIRAVGLTKSFENGGNRIDILSGIDLALDAGETLAIVGASGIGKSTLLHILGTLERPDSGRLSFQGKDVLALNAAKLASLRNKAIGFVFQFHYLLAEFSALENVMMPALIQGLSRQEAKQSAEEILVRVGLAERLQHRAAKLSGGEQQRVALARALVLKPAVLYGDEPTGNLDKHNSQQVHDLLMELNQEFAMTLVVVTHNLELASYMSNRVTIVDGRINEIS